MLTRELIVETAVELLDVAGKDALTVRALTRRLATGSGAIYWHIGTMDELLDAAADTVLAAALPTRPAPPAEPAEGAETTDAGRAGGTPQDEIRAVALSLFDAVTEHPWLAAQIGAQLIRNPWGPVTLRMFESIGRPIRTLGVPRGDWFTTSSALIHYILGATTQNSQHTGDDSAPLSEADRTRFLDTASKAWQDLDPGEYPFVRAIAEQMRGHDDREQFLAGIDLVLTGITTRHPSSEAAVDQTPHDPR
ncbi:TetR family transcriptional regulator [Sphaerisporangium krabiense]|nr:TetR family transcriptional regulator [Sphaerisporangium krabiense]